MLLGYVAAALLGVALLSAGLVTSWFAWGEIALGTTCAIGFAALRGSPFSPPILVHVPTAVAGVALLLSA